MNKKTYIYSVSSLLQIDTPYLCHIDLKISSLTAVTYCRLELQPVVTKIPKCVIAALMFAIVKTRFSTLFSVMGSVIEQFSSNLYFFFIWLSPMLVAFS